ncbi:ABC transporter permease [Brooklawnia cerclae]|uniref:ABC-type dipeptide/oligopeptide/nickel transport system permease subunit n=1 Tax=Brooklawnia cerclae TaxID=349934 RepID=A0ABX0SKA0_9ACTN|nr:ABC transporter permease [Brooklawnia cerclae]NIH58703.1 ABC-type dipeptide/oligopeptide/nickel transport system permease subunit [Brooklawnia cerclae]NIH58827.1 ABC-type dipeptide/oligopeptide/nickel transport system permease subunit [Brooklawnia cerclae]
MSAIEVTGRGALALTWRRLRRDPASVVASLFILALIAFALAAPLVAQWTGHGEAEQFRDTGLTPAGLPVGPSREFLLGTDHLGRDVLVRLAYGARVSLLVGVLASLAASVIAVIVGTVAGFVGGWVDTVLSRLIDLVMSVPFLLCALAIVSVFGASLTLSVSVIIFFSWASLARIIRGQVLSLRQREFIEASRSLGAGLLSMMVVDVLPNLAVTITIYTTMMIPSAIVFEATLSFLGLGIVPPAASWGGMLADASASSVYLAAPWLVLFPGLALLFSTLSFNVLGDSLRDALDPKASRVSSRAAARRFAKMAAAGKKVSA